MHGVVVQILGHHRGERSRADGQLQRAHRGPGSSAPVQHRLGEVESGGWRRSRHRPIGVDRLVALDIGQFPGDIGGQRHFSGQVHESAGIASGLHPPLAVVADSLPHLHNWLFTEPKLRTWRHSTAGTHQRTPPPVCSRLQQQDLDPAPGGFAEPQPGRHNPAVIDHNDIAGAEEIGQIAGETVLRRHNRPAVHQQP